MKFFQTLVLAVALMAVAFSPAHHRIQVLAGPIVNPANGHRYLLLSASTWMEAEAFAKKQGGHLATVRNAEENDWLLNTFAPLTGAADSGLWIGLCDPTKDRKGGAHDANFVWVDGEPVDFTFWYPGEPGNTDGIEYYTAMRNPIDAPPVGSWNDLPNDGGGGSGNTFGVVEMIPRIKVTHPKIHILAGPISNPANGHLYYLLSPSSWTEAEAFAKRNLHSDLVTINDAEENQWVYDTFFPMTPVGSADPQLWIGLNDAAVEGEMVWASGAPVNFTFWYPGEPSNTPNTDPTGEDYTALRSPIDAPPLSSWNDLPNDGGGDKGFVYGVVEVVSHPHHGLIVSSFQSR